MEKSYATANIRHQRNIVALMLVVPLLVFVLVIGVFYATHRQNANAQSSLLFSRNFEDSKVTGGGWSAQRIAADRIRVVTQTDNGKPAPQGSKLLRIELRQGDNPLAQWCCQSTNRAEILADTNEAKGQERWYSWYQMFDTTYPSYDTYPSSQRQGWQLFAQWHGNDSVSPPLAWWAAGDNVVLASGNGNSYIEQWRGAMNRGAWNHIKMRINWGDSGRLVVWYNGMKVLDKTGIDNVTNPPLYFKTGMYRPQSLSARSITYMDDFRMSTSEAGLGVSTNTPVSPTPPPPLPPAPALTPTPVPSPEESTVPPSEAPLTPATPNIDPNKPIEITEAMKPEENGTYIADFNKDGKPEQAIDANGDGFIDPNNEFIVLNSLDESVYGSERKGISDNLEHAGMITIKTGTSSEAKVPKNIVYSFAVATGLSFAGLASFLVGKVMILSGIGRGWK